MKQLFKRIIKWIKRANQWINTELTWLFDPRVHRAINDGWEFDQVKRLVENIVDGKL